jgi:hypothetical protein
VDEIKAGRTGCIEESQEDIEVEPLNVWYVQDTTLNASQLLSRTSPETTGPIATSMARPRRSSTLRWLITTPRRTS